ncbi:MAG: PTS transporter subunit EIIB [Actinomycetaceae bacterium]|nr:PTS transporter subunit EIIB [Actinomycetaceae bacterium]
MSDNDTQKIRDIVDVLGGIGNVYAVEPCVTRLRFEVVDPTIVDASRLRQPLCFGASVVGTAVQVIVGPAADRLADSFSEVFGATPNGS